MRAVAVFLVVFGENGFNSQEEPRKSMVRRFAVRHFSG